MQRCGCEPSLETHGRIEEQWSLEKLRMNQSFAEDTHPLALRTFPTFIDVGVAVQLDVSIETLLPQSPKEYAFDIIASCNEQIQLQTDRFAEWKARTPTQMQFDKGLPIEVGSAVEDFLNDPISAAPNVRFVLEVVTVRPENTDGLVDPFSQNSIRDLKRSRLPIVKGLFNIWVTSLTNNILGFGTFPFQADPAEFGVVVSLESTDARFGGSQAYALNTTMWHEIFHCGGLFHTFMSKDQPLPADAQLPDPLGTGATPQDVIGDGSAMTPPQERATVGDPLNNWPHDNDVYNDAGSVVFFINVMDYSADQSILTSAADQIARFEFFWSGEVLQSAFVTHWTDTGVSTWNALPAPPPVSDVELRVLAGKGKDLTPVIGPVEITGIVLGVAALIAIIAISVYFGTKSHKKKS